MKLSENLDKVLWSLLDKGLYVLYGFVSLLQIRRLDPSVLGIYALLIGINTWLFIIVDSFFLQSIIQFGFNSETERRSNTFALIFTFTFVFVFSSSFSLLSDFWVNFFNEQGLKLVCSYLPFLSMLTIPRVYTLKFAMKHSNMLLLFLVNAAFFIPMSILTIFLFFKYHSFSLQTMMLIYFSGTILSSTTGVVLLKKYIKLGFKGTYYLKDYFKFGFSILSFSISQSIARQLDVFILQYFFQSKIVGIYYSAKTLFRLFEEGLNAAFGLVYPTAVRMIAKNKLQEIQSLIYKSISFTFITIFLMFLFLELGGSEFFIKILLPSRYQMSIPYFNLMMAGSLFMPFQLGLSVLIAQNKLKPVSVYFFFSSLISVIVLFVVGAFNFPNLTPLGIVSYYLLLGSLAYFHIHKEYNFKIIYLTKGFEDILNFILKCKKNNKRI